MPELLLSPSLSASSRNIAAEVRQTYKSVDKHVNIPAFRMQTQPYLACHHNTR